MALLSVFVGSSSEALTHAKDIADLLREEAGRDIEVIGWWQDNAFPAGVTFSEAFVDILRRTNAALLLATPDDKVTRRGETELEPRNNVTFEYGAAVAAHTRIRSALAVIGDPRLPSDVAGVTYLKLKLGTEQLSFKEANRGRIRTWVRQAGASLDATVPSPQQVLPKLYESVLGLIKAQKSRSDDYAGRLDQLSAELLEMIARAFASDVGRFGEMLPTIITSYLADCHAIYAVDVIGPSAWVSPSAYHYLAVQIRRYLRANSSANGFELKVSNELAAAIDQSLATARSWFKDESHTSFDAEDPLQWSRGTPSLEYARILMWSREELLSGVGASVIAIHQAFHIPLFFLERPLNHPDRKYDFIAFLKQQNVVGFVNIRGTRIDLKEMARGRVPGNRKATDRFYELLRDPELSFAVDARLRFSNDSPELLGSNT